MTRRAAYLLSWGVAYSFLGLFFVGSGYSPNWGWLFGVAGLIAIIGALTKPDWLDGLSFIVLAVAAAAKSTWYLVSLFSHFEAYVAFIVIVWGSVAVAQVVASGFPDNPRVKVARG
jgi:hypothetical protein